MTYWRTQVPRCVACGKPLCEMQVASSHRAGLTYIGWMHGHCRNDLDSLLQDLTLGSFRSSVGSFCHPDRAGVSLLGQTNPFIISVIADWITQYTERNK